MIGDKKCLNVKVLKSQKIPEYEGLRVKDILKFSKSKVDIDMYIPNYD